MSALHLRQIEKKLETILYPFMDMSDQRLGSSTYEDVQRSRALAAYIIHHLTACTPQEAAGSIVDGGDDNGLDAIFFHEPEETLYIVQSKWIKDGKGEPDNASVKKFCSGIGDLLGQSYARFNSKVQSKSAAIDEALGIPSLKVRAVLVHTGASEISATSTRDFNDLETETNDASDVLTWMIVNQRRLHLSLTEDLNSPVTVELQIQNWGKIEEPQRAIFGTVTALDLGQLWVEFKDRLVAKNLRGALGDSDVNKEIRATLQNKPEQFWYFNNGITATAKTVKKLPKGGGKHELGFFHCEDFHVVNGAQTVSTIGQFLSKNEGSDLSSCLVQLRVIELGEQGETFGDEVTRTNNRQNKIDAKDFVSQDLEQKRIRTELLIDKINYQIMRREDSIKGERDFDLVESSVALACASGDVNIVVILKNQIGRLWEDLTKAPYKALFNASVSGTYVWNCVQAQRYIDAAIETARVSTKTPREHRILTSGNRLISAAAFKLMNVSRFDDQQFLLIAHIDAPRTQQAVNLIVFSTLEYMNRHYPKAMIPNFFRNQTKSRELFEYIVRQHSKSQIFKALI